MGETDSAQSTNKEDARPHGTGRPTLPNPSLTHSLSQYSPSLLSHMKRVRRRRGGGERRRRLETPRPLFAELVSPMRSKAKRIVESAAAVVWSAGSSLAPATIGLSALARAVGAADVVALEPDNPAAEERRVAAQGPRAPSAVPLTVGAVGPLVALGRVWNRWHVVLVLLRWTH